MGNVLAQKINECDSSDSDSLVRFDDHVLKLIFQHLDTKTLCNLANVSKRFRAIAEHAFRRHHHALVFQEDYVRSTFRQILCKFGHLITSIDVHAYRCGVEEEADINAIIKHCTHLQKLCICHGSVNCELAEAFVGRLSELHLIRCEFVGNAVNMFQQCNNVKVFRISDLGPQSEFIVKLFPKLQQLLLHLYISIETLQELLTLNPQITKLESLFLPDDHLISFIVDNLTELQELKFFFGRIWRYIKESQRGLLRLCELKKLRSLTISLSRRGVYETLTASLVDAFCRENIAIERLELYGFEIDSIDVKSVSMLRQLKVLSLSYIQTNTANDWILLATDLPELSKLSLHFKDYDGEVCSVDALVRMAYGGQKLKYLKLDGIRNLNIELQEFEEILNAVKTRNSYTKLIIEIFGRSDYTKFDVPEFIQRTASKHLEIIYRNRNRGHCSNNLIFTNRYHPEDLD